MRYFANRPQNYLYAKKNYLLKTHLKYTDKQAYWIYIRVVLAYMGNFKLCENQRDKPETCSYR